jgi:hypothetical protein
MVSDTQESAPQSAADSKSTAEDSAVAWLLRGLVLGVLVLGSANALSFFFRSRGWGSLLGSREMNDEAIGFPLMIWEEGSGYGSHPLQVLPFAIDIATALLLGTVIGVLAIWQRPALNPIMDRFRRESAGSDVRLQFSLRGLLITTVLAALASAAVRAFTPRVEVLAAIYALGPAALIALAYLPRRLSWQQRVAIITPSALILIVVAIALGGVLEVEFDKVLMGIFICWTPQAAIGAVALTAYLLIKEYRALRAS